MIIWFTGLSGAGKSTLAKALVGRLLSQGMQPLLIDGDALREELCKDLDFSLESRIENIRRAGAIALIAARSGITSICALISPLQRERDLVRIMAETKGIRFVEVYVSTPLSVCEDRDTKGLYKKARAGMIPQFTGIDSPYEPPLHPEVELPTERLSIEECLAVIAKKIASS